MSSHYRCHLKPYIQPFERTLAFAELSALTENRRSRLKEFQCETSKCIDVHSGIPAKTLANALAYWESINNGDSNYTVQVLREATVSIARNGVPVSEFAEMLPFRTDVPLPSRRTLRYGTHGLHEYRGKFFPQLVRALINIGRVPTKGIVADPMCGSGTTLVETILSKRRGLGLDLNPLSVRLAHAKCLLLNADPDVLRKAHDAVQTRLLKRDTNGTDPLHYFRKVPAVDQQYLGRWFSVGVLRDLDSIVASVQMVHGELAREFFFIVLSNILRRVSWQKTDDLRVRKDRPAEQIDTISAFLAEAERSLRMVLAFLYQNGKMPRADFQIEQGDARDVGRLWARWRGRVDAVITSPPYATALPYLDTDRLSLCYLRLLTRPEHRRRDLAMIGNREITETKRREYLQCFRRERASLPGSVARLIGQIDRLNTNADVGFRRRNVSALLAKYFLDMRQVLKGIAAVAKPGAPIFIVVGSNHTIAGGRRVDIKTGELLGEVAEMMGFERDPDLAMEMLQSRDIFKHNASDSETLLMLKAPIYSSPHTFPECFTWLGHFEMPAAY